MQVMDDSHDDSAPHRIPIEDHLDLHPFRPAEVASVVSEYLDEAVRAGFHQVRLIHGKGKGALRQTVAALLSRHPRVDSFTVAPPEAGGWGATIVWLRMPAMPTRPVGKAAPAKLKVLFLCTANACRSQMAEGWAHALKSDRIEAHSAGIAPCYLHPLAERVMKEAGVDISRQYSKHVDEYRDARFDYVVTLCGHADSKCPVYPGQGMRIHRPFEDPVRVQGTDDEVIAAFRATRDAIRAFVEGMPENLFTV
jgi:arsenate reductase